MKSVVASAVLGAAVLAQAASIGHSHGHVHRRAPTPAVQVEKTKRTVSYISTADIDILESKNILVGKNEACSSEATTPVTVGSTGGPFVVEFTNNHSDDIVLIVWSADASSLYTAPFIGTSQADVTHTLQANTSTWISFDPAKNSGSVSGAWGALYPGQSLTEWGQLDNTWGEYTFTTENEFSTTDVSRLINMNGNAMTIENYATQADADDANTAAACTANLDTCAFVCSGSLLTCISGLITGCTAGTAGTTSDASGLDGGCSGMTATGGYVKVSFE